MRAKQSENFSVLLLPLLMSATGNRVSVVYVTSVTFRESVVLLSLPPDWDPPTDALSIVNALMERHAATQARKKLPRLRRPSSRLFSRG